MVFGKLEDNSLNVQWAHSANLKMQKKEITGLCILKSSKRINILQNLNLHHHICFKCISLLVPKTRSSFVISFPFCLLFCLVVSGAVRSPHLSMWGSYGEVTQYRGTSASQGSVCVVVWRESTSSFPCWALQHEEQCPYFFLIIDLETPLPCEATVLWLPHPGLPVSFLESGLQQCPVSPTICAFWRSQWGGSRGSAPVFLEIGFYSFCHTFGVWF